jgi:hypothetical protein
MSMKLRPLALATLALATGALAQPQPPVTPDTRTQIKEQLKEYKQQMKSLQFDDHFLADLDEQLLRMPAGDAFFAHEFGHSREIVKNAPYTAEAITESVQVLPDGNRIVNKSTTLLARDTAGRTRIERKGGGRGGVYIYDPMEGRMRVPAPPEPPVPPVPPAAPTPPVPPAAGSNVDVQPGRVIVRRNRTEGGADQNVQVEVTRIGRGDRDAAVPPPVPLPPLMLPILPRGKGETKSLGTREFDGIKAEGTMTSHTIPAGQIGNEKPIVITSERWFSPELFIVVYAKTSDPRAGESTYRVTIVKRGEPPAELFAVPERRTRGERRS